MPSQTSRGLSRKQVAAELQEVEEDLRALKAAAKIIEKRGLTSDEGPSRFHQFNESPEFHALMGVFLMGVSRYKKLFGDYTELLDQIDSGDIENSDPRLRLISNGRDTSDDAEDGPGEGRKAGR